MNAEITESMNTFWAECYESYKNALDTRNKLVAESRKTFQVANENLQQIYADYYCFVELLLNLVHSLLRTYCNL